tara:strand:+ start:530 stop:688 length:159 start_codon:yes stop_codon:yes gene_type:complete
MGINSIFEDKSLHPFVIFTGTIRYSCFEAVDLDLDIPSMGSKSEPSSCDYEA